MQMRRRPSSTSPMAKAMSWSISSSRHFWMHVVSLRQSLIWPRSVPSAPVQNRAFQAVLASAGPSGKTDNSAR